MLGCGSPLEGSVLAFVEIDLCPPHDVRIIHRGHHLTPHWTIRRAVPDDAAAVAEFGRRTFEDAFGASAPPEDVADFLATNYGAAIQRAEIERQDATTLVVESAGELVGYAMVEVGSNPAVDLDRQIQLHRLYLDRGLHGSGIASALLAAAQDAARELGGMSMWLSVWDRNERAIAFYRKTGFTIVGTVEFAVGADVQTDHLMAMSLGG
jgi:ribosomal protein S18 acetylase RimI-like enzyme